MEVFSNLLFGFSVSLSPAHVLAAFCGVVAGTAIGVLPGIGPVAAMSLALPIVIHLPTTAGIIVMAAIFYGSMYGGSTTAILLKVPGEAGSVVTCLDGHEMAKQGRAGPALAISAWGSFIAGTLGVVGISLLAPPLAELALQIGPPEMVVLLVLSFVMIILFSGGDRVKAGSMVFVGFLLSTVGLDPVESTPRFEFGTFVLLDGVGFAPLIIGLFGVSEVLASLENKVSNKVISTRISGTWPNRQDWKASLPAIGRGGALGFFLGILPGMGAIVPSFLSYYSERALSKAPQKFGKGAIEGVAGPEAANNAATAGSQIPLLTLGIAPSAAVAVLAVAFLAHGVQPGPLLISEHPDIFWGVVTSMYIGNVMLLVLNLPLVGLWARLITIPYRYLFAPILILCAIGTFTVANNSSDVLILAVFGLLGYILRKFEYPAAPLILAYVLGRFFEESVRQSLVMSRGGYEIFFSHPVSLCGWTVVALILIVPLLSKYRGRRRVAPTSQ